MIEVIVFWFAIFSLLVVTVLGTATIILNRASSRYLEARRAYLAQDEPRARRLTIEGDRFAQHWYLRLLHLDVP